MRELKYIPVVRRSEYANGYYAGVEFINDRGQEPRLEQRYVYDTHSRKIFSTFKKAAAAARELADEYNKNALHNEARVDEWVRV